MSEIRIVATQHSGYVSVEPTDDGYGNVDLNLGHIEKDNPDTTWVSLTPDEARAVAAALIHQASEDGGL